MKHLIRPCWVAVGLMLAGCSSPPEPMAVKWDATPTTVNSTLPLWQENHVVVHSPDVVGSWSKRITDFQGDNGSYGPDFYYAVVHSTRIVVASNSSSAWFNTKAWLQLHGATAPIEFNRKLDCLTCNTVDVYLSRSDFASK
ncbi:cag pathogenicity island Cag12 family protein [Yersinia pseudotuberculosis]|uniref:cag pathogenicity island Cag12 family protein n=1 Tax=Yersinia pseudotuberculosis TaxID=633 RepID=UPI0005E593D2|nr:cag pathogenicity island Cag12 family protein [Yersinia pseudotuberculosis]CNM04149.1 Uncharacterised protein [Yersinia pseudotuberculosis]